MLHVTPRARSELHDLLARFTSDDPARALASFRLYPETPQPGASPGLGLMLDEPGDGDEVIQHERRNILILDRVVSQKLDGLTLDLVKTPDGERLTLRR